MQARTRGRRWRLADVIDFETLAGAPPDDRRAAPRLPDDFRFDRARTAPGQARRAGFRAWLAAGRAAGRQGPGAAWIRAARLIAALLFALMAALGAGLVFGLCLGQNQRVHVVLFLAATLLVPWLVLAVLLAARALAGQASAPQRWLIDAVARVAARTTGPAADAIAGGPRAAALVESGPMRRAFAARLARISQWGGLGFALGAVLAFVAVLAVFDLRFYWEATPQNDRLVTAAVAVVGAPWAAFWPAAVPDQAVIRASRRPYHRAAATPAARAVAARWWRFLGLALVVWGVLPRLALIAVLVGLERRALNRLDFQTPRHRELWRRLAGIERGAVAAQASDHALVLDVGGHGFACAAIRGFMLRRLRLNPQALHCVSVLDDAEEARADAALAAGPGHVVPCVVDWSLSPQRTAAVQQRLRAALGAETPITWVVAGGEAERPASPDAAHLARWTRFIDGLGDPATEIAGYDPAA